MGGNSVTSGSLSTPAARISPERCAEDGRVFVGREPETGSRWFNPAADARATNGLERQRRYSWMECCLGVKVVKHAFRLRLSGRFEHDRRSPAATPAGVDENRRINPSVPSTWSFVPFMSLRPAIDRATEERTSEKRLRSDVIVCAEGSCLSIRQCKVGVFPCQGGLSGLRGWGAGTKGTQATQGTRPTFIGFVGLIRHPSGPMNPSGEPGVAIRNRGSADIQPHFLPSLPCHFH
jgi:hypothetical protein